MLESFELAHKPDRLVATGEEGAGVAQWRASVQARGQLAVGEALTGLGLLDQAGEFVDAAQDPRILARPGR